MKPRAAGALLLVALLVATPFVLGLPVALPEFLVERIAPTERPPPPTVELGSPRDGAGVAGSVLIAGNARAGHAGGAVTDVQYRIGDAQWHSIPDVQRGLLVAPFRIEVPVPAGDHLVAVRAVDGPLHSFAPSALVRSGSVAAPTVSFLTPADGAGLVAGLVEVRGTAEGAGIRRVLVGEPGAPTEAQIVTVDPRGATWRASIPLAPGPRTIMARAEGEAGQGLPRSVVVGVGVAHPPPELTILRPAHGEGIGSAGTDACSDRCILFSGVHSGVAKLSRIEVTLDGLGPFLADSTGGAIVGDAAGAWTFPLPLLLYFRGEHHASFVGIDEHGERSAPRNVSFLVNAGRELRVVGDLEPRETSTPLTFALDAPGVKSVRWLLDGTPVGTLPSVTLKLDQPGAHTLTVEATASGDDGARATIPLYAINRKPTVIADAVGALAGEDARFFATARDPEGGISGFAWSFGDGEAASTTAPGVAHAYPRSGVYEATVVAYDELGLASEPATVSVAIGNRLPTAAFTHDAQNATILDEVRFADHSSDPDGRIVRRTWSFGDGSPPRDGASVAHQFISRGAHLVTLEVEDNDGARADAAKVVLVENLPPLAAFVAEPAIPRAGEAVTFLDRSMDPDGVVVSWRWEFGESGRAAGARARHAFPTPGEHEVRLVVTDDAGGRANATLRILVSDAPPSLSTILLDPEQPTALHPIRFRAVAFDHEGPIERVRWTFGDGNSSDELEPSHAYARSGTYTVGATIVDAAGQVASLARQVHVMNAPPVARLSAPHAAYVGFPATIESHAFDPDGQVVRWEFDLDADGVPDCPVGEPRCTFLFSKAGPQRIALRVWDDEGYAVSAETILDVLPAPRGLSPPTVEVALPLPGSTVRGELHAQGRAFGANPVALVEAQVRNGSWIYAPTRELWIPARGTGDWFLALDTRSLPDGPIDLVIRATDTEGSWNETRIPLLVDNDREPAGFTLDAVNLDEDEVLAGEYVVRGTAWHPQGVTGIRWRVDDAPWRHAAGHRAAWEIPIDARQLDPGRHVLHVDAYHGVFERASLAIPFRVPNQRPSLLVDVPPGPAAYAILHAEGRTSPSAAVLWRVDDDVWRPAEGAMDWRVRANASDWSPGPHVVRIKAVDRESGLESEAFDFHVRFFHGDVREADLRASSRSYSNESPAWGALGAMAALVFAALGSRRR